MNNESNKSDNRTGLYSPEDGIKIKEYFEKLSYPKIYGDPKCVLVHKLGTVYIVEFAQDQNESGLVPYPTCYAIIKDGIVAGYKTDFWTDANQHRLVLKQHVGMLEMEKSEKDGVSHPLYGIYGKAGDSKSVEPDRVSISPEVLNSIVETYEEKIKEMKDKSDRKIKFLSDGKIKLSNYLVEAQLKLALVKDVLSGKAVRVANESSGKASQEQDVIGSIFDDPENDATEIAEEGMNGQNESVGVHAGIPGIFGTVSPSDLVQKKLDPKFESTSASSDSLGLLGQNSLYSPVPAGQIQSHISGAYSDYDRERNIGKRRASYPSAPNTPLSTPSGDNDGVLSFSKNATGGLDVKRV